MSERTGGAASLLLPVTSARIALVPVVMALVLGGEEVESVAAAVFALAAATDFADGYLARRWGSTSTLGSFLDTTADKLLVSGALIALVAVGRASPWIAAIIVGRELLILGLRGVAAASGTVFPPSVWGKAKTILQFVAIFLAIVHYPEPLGPLLLDEWAMGAAAIVTILSAVEYLSRFSSLLTSPAGR